MKRLTRAEKQAQTRQALLDAARAVFIERGFAGASVEQITAAAGFSRGAFYSNFESKEELFAELLQQQVFETYREMARTRIARGESPPIEQTAEELAAVVRDPGWPFRLLLELLAHAGRDPELRKIAARFWSGTRDLVEQVVAQEYDNAGTKPPADPRTIASGLIAIDIGLAIQHYVDAEDVPLSVYPEVYELFVRSLNPR